MRSNLFALLILGLCLYVARHRVMDFFVERKVPVGLTTQGSCAGKKTCGVIYLAPWCPACNAMEPALKTLVQHAPVNPEQGVLIVVGQGRSAEENEAKAREIGADVITDNNGAYFKALRIRQFPTFLVVEKSKVTHENQQAVSWFDESFGFTR